MYFTEPERTVLKISNVKQVISMGYLKFVNLRL